MERAGPMQYGKDAGIAKLLVADGPKHAGMGIVIHSRHVLTCAHVVNAAVSRPVEGTLRPKGSVSVVFPFSKSTQAIEGKVAVWHPMGATPVADVAVIDLDEDVPADVGMTAFALVYRPLDGDPLVVFGTAAGHKRGNHIDAEFMGPTSGAEAQIDGVNAAGVFIQGGYSGAAVWDTVHQAAVGMVRAVNVGSDAQVAYMTSAAALVEVCPNLPVEDRRLPRSFNLIWTAITSLFFLLLLWLFLVNRGVSDVLQSQLAAFWGMHVYAFLAPVIGWLWYLYVNDFKLHNWSARIPKFANIQIDPNSAAEKTVWMASVVLLMLLPLYAQGHFLDVFHTQGRVFIYPDKFGFTVEELQTRGRCLARTVPLCEPPEAGRYSTVTPKPPSGGAYWDNAYHYGDDLGVAGQKPTMTFFPILQPLIVIGLTFLAIVLHAGALLRIFFQSEIDGLFARPGGLRAPEVPGQPNV
jgi:hypothetical protein